MKSNFLDIHPSPLVPFQPDWIFWVLLGMFLLITWIQILNPQRLRLIISALVSKRDLHQLEREGNLLNERISIALSLIYVFSSAMMIYQVLQLIFHQTSSIPPFRLYLLLTLAVAGFWSFKVFIMNLLAHIFQTEGTNHAYKLNILITISFLGLLMIPILVVAIYLKSVWALYIGLGFIGSFSLFRLIKGFLIGISLMRFSYFFLFVYLCTLEILPLLVAAKLIMDYL